MPPPSWKPEVDPCLTMSGSTKDQGVKVRGRLNGSVPSKDFTSVPYTWLHFKGEGIEVDKKEEGQMKANSKVKDGTVPSSKFPSNLPAFTYQRGIGVDKK